MIHIMIMFSFTSNYISLDYIKILKHCSTFQIHSPVCWKLGNEVLETCAAKLKPHLLDQVLRYWIRHLLLDTILDNGGKMSVRLGNGSKWVFSGVGQMHEPFVFFFLFSLFRFKITDTCRNLNLFYTMII